VATASYHRSNHSSEFRECPKTWLYRKTNVYQCLSHDQCINNHHSVTVQFSWTTIDLWLIQCWISHRSEVAQLNCTSTHHSCSCKQSVVHTRWRRTYVTIDMFKFTDVTASHVYHIICCFRQYQCLFRLSDGFYDLTNIVRKNLLWDTVQLIFPTNILYDCATFLPTFPKTDMIFNFHGFTHYYTFSPRWQKTKNIDSHSFVGGCRWLQ